MQQMWDGKQILVTATATAAAIGVALYLVHAKRERDGLAMRPPRLVGTPLVGHTLQLQRSKELVSQFRALYEKHGDFVVDMGGFRFMCLFHPADFPIIWREPADVFSFEDFGNAFASRVNGLPFEAVENVTSRVDKVKAYSYLRGDSLAATARQIQHGFYVAVDRLGLSAGTDAFVDAELQDIVGPIFLFCALAGQVRGLTSKPFTEDIRVLYKNVSQFAKDAIIIGMGGPEILFPKFRAARDYFGAFLGRHINLEDDKFFRERCDEWGRERGFDVPAALAADITSWIGVLGNNLPTFIWIVLFLHHPTNAKWLSLIRDEVDALHLSAAEEDFLSIEKESYAKMPVTSAFLNEVLRIVTKASSIRRVVQDCDRVMPATGQTYHFSKGDFIFLNGFLLMNENDELGFRDVFDPSHFLSSSPAATETTATPTANSSSSTSSSSSSSTNSGIAYSDKLFLFGGGKSLCPGRFLVVVQHKSVLAHFLHNFELEMTRPTKTLFENVDFDFGGATAVPCNDIPVRIRRRKH